MIPAQKLTIEQIIKVVNGIDEISIDTQEHQDEWNELKLLIADNLRIDEITADEEKFLLKMLRGVVYETKQEIIEKFESLKGRGR